MDSTRLAALKQHIADGIQRKQQEKVLWVLRVATGWKWELSREQIEGLCGMRTSSACARLNELVALGKVEVVGEKVSPTTNKRVQTYRAVLTPKPCIYPQGVLQCPSNI